MILRKSFYIRWSAGRSPRVHEVNPGRDPSPSFCLGLLNLSIFFLVILNSQILLECYSISINLIEFLYVCCGYDLPLDRSVVDLSIYLWYYSVVGFYFSFRWSPFVHSLEIIQWDSTRRDHPGYPRRVSGSGLVMYVSLLR